MFRPQRSERIIYVGISGKLKRGLSSGKGGWLVWSILRNLLEIVDYKGIMRVIQCSWHYIVLECQTSTSNMLERILLVSH